MKAQIYFKITPDENTPFFLLLNIPGFLEIESWDVPSDVTVTDPFYLHVDESHDVELAFPALPPDPNGFSVFTEGMVTLKLKLQGTGPVPGATHRFQTYYDDRDADGFPLNPNIASVNYKFPKSYISVGENILLSDLLYNELMPPNGIQDDPYNIAINGSLIIDVDWELSHPGHTILMFDGAKLTIEDAKASFSGTKFTACDTWWDAIEVGDGGRLEFTNDYQSQVEKAVHGVRLLEGSDTYIDRVRFFDNVVGIYSPPSTGGTFKNSYLKVENSQFKEVDFAMPPSPFPYQSAYPLQLDHPYAGIELHDMTTWFNECDSGPLCGNLIAGMYHGIILDHAPAYLSGFRIEDLHDDPLDQMPFANTGVSSRTDAGEYSLLNFTGYGKEGDYLFKNLGTAIRLQNVHAKVEATRMENVANGIWHTGNNLRNFEARDNMIYAKEYGILSFLNSEVTTEIHNNDISHAELMGGGNVTTNSGYGIAMVNNLSNGNVTNVKYNTIHMPKAKAGIYGLNTLGAVIAENTVMGGNRSNEYGIRLSGGSGVAVDCNLLERPSGSVTDPSAGIYIQMMDEGAIRCNDITAYPRGIEYFGTSTGSLMEGNLLEDHMIGLLYDHEASTGKHEFSGNRWLSQYGDYDLTDESGAINTGPKELIEGSRYEVNESADPSFGTSVWSDGIPWFFDQVGTNKICGNQLITCDDGPGANLIDPRPLDSLAWWIAVDSFLSPNYGDGAIWTARRQLYRRLAASPEWVTSGSVWESFMNTHATSSVGVYEAIRQGWIVMPSGSDTLQSELSLATELQDSLIGSLSQIIETISETTDTSLLQTLITQQAQIETSIHANELELDSLYVDLVDLRNTHLLALSTANAAASTSEDWTEAQQQANALMFKAAMQGIGVLDSTDRTQLELIADECPMILGEAVFQARGLLTSLDPGRNWDDASNCLMAQPRFQESIVSKSATLNVWPNPAQSHIYIQLGGEPTLDWDVTLLNAYGQMVVSLNLNSGLQGIEFTDLVPGFYVLVASNSKGERLNTRVLITR